MIKDLFYKYIILDSLIYSLYISFIILLGYIIPDSVEKNLNQWHSAIIFLVFFVILPIIYNTIKWYFLIENHPKFKTIYYPIIEIFIYVIWLVGIWLLYETIFI